MSRVKEIIIHKVDLKKMRKAAGLTQQEMSAIMKVSRVQYINYENDKYAMDLESWENLKNTLNEKIDPSIYFKERR